MSARKQYTKPAIRSAELELGVFGEYGQGGGPGTNTPGGKIVDYFDIDRP